MTLKNIIYNDDICDYNEYLLVSVVVGKVSKNCSE